LRLSKIERLRICPCQPRLDFVVVRSWVEFLDLLVVFWELTIHVRAGQHDGVYCSNTG